MDVKIAVLLGMTFVGVTHGLNWRVPSWRNYPRVFDLNGLSSRPTAQPIWNVDPVGLSHLGYNHIPWVHDLGIDVNGIWNEFFEDGFMERHLQRLGYRVENQNRRNDVHCENRRQEYRENLNVGAPYKWEIYVNTLGEIGWRRVPVDVLLQEEGHSTSNELREETASENQHGFQDGIQTNIVDEEIYRNEYKTPTDMDDSQLNQVNEDNTLNNIRQQRYNAYNGHSMIDQHPRHATDAHNSMSKHDDPSAANINSHRNHLKQRPPLRRQSAVHPQESQQPTHSNDDFEYQPSNTKPKVHKMEPKFKQNVQENAPPRSESFNEEKLFSNIETLATSNGHKVLSKHNPRNRHTNGKHEKLPQMAGISNTPKNQQDLHSRHIQQPIEMVRFQLPEQPISQLRVKAEGQYIKILGQRRCACDESCVLREFERRFPFPKGTDLNSLDASVGEDKVLRVSGISPLSSNDHMASGGSRDIPVQGLERLPVPVQHCDQQKPGAHTSSRTGKPAVHVHVAPRDNNRHSPPRDNNRHDAPQPRDHHRHDAPRQDHHRRRFEEAPDRSKLENEDDVLIEVVDNYHV